MTADLPMDVKTSTVRAFNKVLWVQNDLFAKYYVDDETRHCPVTGETGKCPHSQN